MCPSLQHMLQQVGHSQKPPKAPSNIEPGTNLENAMFLLNLAAVGAAIGGPILALTGIIPSMVGLTLFGSGVVVGVASKGFLDGPASGCG